MVQDRYAQSLETVLNHRRIALIASAAIMATSCYPPALRWPGLLPSVDAGQIRLHVRAQPGTRIETTKVLFSQVEGADSQGHFPRMNST